MIHYNERENSFHLSTEKTSYIIAIHKNAYPLHMYWGRRVYGDDVMWALDAPYRRYARIMQPEPDEPAYTHEFFPWEYPDFGTGDFRPAAYSVIDPNGDNYSDARYVGYRILDGKPPLEGLPSVNAMPEDGAETLVISLYDEKLRLAVDLYYTVYEKYDVIARHTEFRYDGEEPSYLTKALSVSIDAPQGFDEMIQLCGSALREKHIVRRPIANGTTGFGSIRGVSSHQETPFAALVGKNTTEHTGEAWAMTLVYSGNFSVTADCDPYGSVRVQMGINETDFRWQLTKGSTFITPEALLVYSGEGLNGMSHTFHTLLRERVGRGSWTDKERPVLLNTWEACYFTFDHDHVMKLAQAAKKAGMELLVLDDGWFGHRDNATSSLGDWFVDKKKLPRGLKALADDVNALGLKFGLWFEPEMISVDSELYKAHPDWCLHVADRKRSEWRDQLYLDLSRADVQEYIIDSLTEVLSGANIEYVKWDNNRRMSEAGSDLLPRERKGEIYHRYVLGLYRVLDILTKRFPDILWENCSSGGARFDVGMMCYFAQNWASDDTDGTARLKIQYGSSLLMPPVWITSHISECPNHQIGRTTPLSYREHSSMPFNMGYELNMLRMTDEELAMTNEQVKRYKALRRMIQFGEFTRLQDPFDGENCAWQTASEDGREVLVWYYKPFVQPEEAYLRVFPTGLDEKAEYTDTVTGRVLTGSMIMQIGLPIDWHNGDSFSQMWHLIKK